MSKERKSSFRGKVGADARKSTRTQRGYLNLPDGIKLYTIEENARKVELDILPYVVSDPHHPNRDNELDIATPGSLWYRRPFRVHRNVGAENESYVCPRSVGKPCPICDYQKKRFSEGADKEETKELYPKDRNLYVVIPIGQSKFEEEPHIWDMSQALFQDTLKEELEINSENEVFPDLQEGKTLELSLKWKSLGNNTFPEVRSISFLDRDPYKDSILEDVPDLDTVLKVLPYDELSAKFFDVEPENELINEETTHKRAEHKEESRHRERATETRQTRSRRTPVEEEPEEEPEEEQKEEPEEEKKPVRGKAKEEPQEQTTRRRERGTASATKDKCPYGHKYGIDTDKYDECNTCELWDGCVDEFDKSQK